MLSTPNPGRILWGYYEIRLDPDSGQVEAVPARLASDHWNVLKWLEGGPCTNCVKVVSVTDSDHGTKLFDVKITHPFPNMNLTGFDVRGIAMFNGSYTFTAEAKTVPDRSAGDGELINADGYTGLYCGGTEGSGPSGLQGYIKGKYATPTVPSAQLNGFKCYSSDFPDNSRCIFNAGDSITRTYDIDMPDAALVLGYAVDACWVPATNKPVSDPETDFPPEANCPEPWKIVVAEEPVGLGLTSTGGKTILTVDVYDHQGKGSYSQPTIDIPGLTPDAVPIDWLEDGDGYSRYRIEITNIAHLPAGFYKCLIQAIDNEDATAPDWLDLTGYQVYSLEIKEYEQTGWARTWGGTEWDGGGLGVDTDAFGNSYVVGEYQGTVDFDPGSGVEEHTTVGGRDACMVKYDQVGDLVWVKTWGGTGFEYCKAIKVTDDGFLYLTGSFSDTVDFDPGPGTHEEVSQGGLDGYVLKLTQDGDFVSVICWGGPDADYGVVITANDLYVYSGFATSTELGVRRFNPDGSIDWVGTWGAGANSINGISLDNDHNLYVGGGFENTVDFNPGPGTDDHSSNGSTDCYLSKFDSSMAYQWCVTWGGTSLDGVQAAEVHGTHTIIVGGRFSDTVDFDPGPDVEQYTSNGWDDAFLEKFNEDGEMQWVRTWGGAGVYGEWDYVNSLSMDDYMNIFVTGVFGATVDFDPGSGVAEATSSGQVDVFLSKFNTMGTFQWVRTWGGVGEDTGYGVAVSCYLDILVTGSYFDTVDFDPGAGEDLHTSKGQRDVFLSKFTKDGEW
jgi:hypothetical protein